MNQDSDETMINSDDWQLLNGGSPHSESLLQGHVELVEHKVVEVGVQTERCLPGEDLQRSGRVGETVQLLRGLLGVKEHCIRMMVEPAVWVEDEESVHANERTSEAFDRNEERRIRGLRENRREVVDKSEPFRYAMRYSNEDNAVEERLADVANYIAEECLQRSDYVTEHWTGSLMELSADTLMRAANADSFHAARLVTRLCHHLIALIGGSEEICLVPYQLECISNVILKLAESPTIGNELIDQLLSILESYEEVFIQPNLIPYAANLDNFYHFGRLLSILLRRFQDHVEETGLPEPVKPNEGTDILNLWRTHWKPSAANPRTQRNTNPPASMIAKRLMRLENLARISLELLPMFSHVIVECLEIVRGLHIQENMPVEFVGGEGAYDELYSS